MKLILSRKGFDSGYGGCASPIFDDGSMVSFPIPFAGAKHRIREATVGNRHFASHDVLADLTRRRAAGNRLDSDSEVHLDPYLARSESAAPTGWKPAFGQDGGAQGHLLGQNVGVGDLFLFFGWFRRVELRSGRWRYVPRSPDLHVVFGWLQIGEILRVDSGFMLDSTHEWLSDHPHWQERSSMAAKNTIYVAADRLRLGDHAGPEGGGVFDTFRTSLQLTAPEARSRSDWQLPGWFHPDANGLPMLSHHGNIDRWTREPEGSTTTRLRSVPIGQEFVIALASVPGSEPMTWLNSMFD